MTLEVVEPGFLTTVQDAGRPEWAHLGVPRGGACDRWSLAVANLLAGNDAGAAAIEMTLAGPALAVRETTMIGLAGANLDGVVLGTGRRLEPGRSHRLEAGWTVAFPGGTSTADAGLRAYLALPGGLDVKDVLGSASTLLSAGFGGIDGRALRTGDVLRGRRGGEAAAQGLAWPTSDGDPIAGRTGQPIRVVAGPADASLDALVDAEWRVGAASDRVGLRLEGPSLAAADVGELLSHGVVDGAIQLPPGGAPIVLLADHQTTGGYPIVAVVISADHPRIGQLRPGATVRFVDVSLADARAALVEQRTAFERGAAALRRDSGWDDLWQSAGA